MLAYYSLNLRDNRLIFHPACAMIWHIIDVSLQMIYRKADL